MIDSAINILSKRQNLNLELMRGVMEEIMSGQAGTAEIVSFLEALSAKGETIDELTAAVQVLRSHATKINSKHRLILDTCGTGADKSGTFNISTTVAFVASASGIIVAKHGNRSVSSKCGSADVLEALGIDIHMPKERIEKCLDDIGIAFLFAQDLHPAMKYAMPARIQIGKKTLFNMLGPLSNPAGATHQLVGIFDKRWLGPLAQVLANLGSEHALVVHGEDGLDEITTTGKTYISEVRLNKINNFEITPEEFGFPRARPQDLLGGNSGENAGILIDILKGKSGPKRDIVLLNTAAAIYAADRAGSIKEGVIIARDSIDSGKALEKLELFKKNSSKN